MKALEHTTMALLEAVPEATPLAPLSVPGAAQNETRPAGARAGAGPASAPRRREAGLPRGSLPWRGLLRRGLLRRGPLTPVFAVAAATLAATVILAAGSGRLPSPARAFAHLTMGSQTLGQVSLTAGRQVAVAISLRNVPGVRSVRCIVWQHSGRGATIGSFAVSGGRATWSGQSPWPISTLRSVELVSAGGRKVAVARIHV